MESLIEEIRKQSQLLSLQSEKLDEIAFRMSTKDVFLSGSLGFILGYMLNQPITELLKWLIT